MAEMILLGTAQDGGLPHAGCACAACERARRDPAFSRLPTSVGLVDGETTVLIDATNAFAEQIRRLWQASATPHTNERGRFPAPGTILLTHAHTGHYVGLWQLDRSVLAAPGVQVFGPPDTIALLSNNEPWPGMVADGFLALARFTPGESFAVSATLSVTPLSVPHRSEWDTDTVAFHIEGTERSALYLPDIDTWEEWEHDIAEVAASVDIALLDATFWEPFPRPRVVHPPVTETLDRLQTLVDTGATRVILTHLNHTNPLVDPESRESRIVAERGFHVAREGEAFTL